MPQNFEPLREEAAGRERTFAERKSDESERTFAERKATMVGDRHTSTTRKRVMR